MPYTDKQKEYYKQYYKKNAEKYREKNRRYYRENTSKSIEYAKRWAKANPEKRREIEKRWREANPGICGAKSVKRHCAKKRRVPRWADLRAIQQIYANCPEDHEVDHIVPLQGEFVSGLHVEYNLQYLPTTENRRKSNRWEVK